MVYTLYTKFDVAALYGYWSWLSFLSRLICCFTKLLHTWFMVLLKCFSACWLFFLKKFTGAKLPLSAKNRGVSWISHYNIVLVASAFPSVVKEAYYQFLFISCLFQIPEVFLLVKSFLLYNHVNVLGIFIIYSALIPSSSL